MAQWAAFCRVLEASRRVGARSWTSLGHIKLHFYQLDQSSLLRALGEFGCNPQLQDFAGKLQVWGGVTDMAWRLVECLQKTHHSLDVERKLEFRGIYDVSLAL